MRRRGYGEGTIRRRKDGLYEARLSDGSEGGRRRQRSLYAKTYRQAQVKLAEERRKREAGWEAGDRQTVREFLEQWLEQTAKQRVRPRTFIDYAAIARNHLIPALGRYSLQELSRNPEVVQRLLNAKREDLSAGRVNQIRVVLHSAMKQAMLWRRVMWNVADLVTAGQPSPGPKRVFTAEQALRFLQAVRGDKLYVLYVLCLSAGLRQSEAFGLRWERIDLEAREIQVAATVQRAQGRVWFAEPKSRKSRRSFPLTGLAVDALRELGPRSKGLVFTTRTGTPLHGHNLTRRSYYPALERAGLPRIPFRNLRHACGSLLLSLGVDLPTIQAILGHARFSTTADHYLEPSRAAMRDAMTRLNGLLTTTDLPPVKEGLVGEERGSR